MKSTRERVVLAQQPLWPLSAILQAACSDDETDEEGVSPRAKRPVKVRRLGWRSLTLESVCLLVDEWKGKLDESIPNSSPGTSGRQPRRRVWGDDRPVSRLEAPIALPVDCYLEEWLSTLSSLERTQLGIHPSPVLQNFISTLKSYM